MCVKWRRNVAHQTASSFHCRCRGFAWHGAARGVQPGCAAAGGDERTSSYSSNPAGGVGIRGGRHAANGSTRRSEAIRFGRSVTCSSGIACARRGGIASGGGHELGLSG